MRLEQLQNEKNNKATEKKTKNPIKQYKTNSRYTR